MKRTWMIPAILLAGVTGIGAFANAAHAQDNGWRDRPGYSRGEGPDDYSGRRWSDEDRRGGDEYGPRWRRGDRGFDGDRGPRWRDDDRRGDGPRQGWRGDDGDRDGPRGYGWRDREGGWGYHRHHGPREGRGYGWREGRGFDRRDGFGRGYGPRMERRRFGRMFGPGALDSVKRELGITAQQDAAWTAYTAAVKTAADNARARRQSIRDGAARNLSTDDYRKLRDSVIEQRRKDADSIRNAADDLVKSFDEKQTAIAREVLPGYSFGRGMAGMRGMGMGMGMDRGSGR